MKKTVLRGPESPTSAVAPVPVTRERVIAPINGKTETVIEKLDDVEKKRLNARRKPLDRAVVSARAGR